MGQKHQKLAERIMNIITRLNTGEILDTQALAEEFSISKRTLQRDINDRLAFLPLQKKGSLISLEQIHFGKLSPQDIRNFSCISGVESVFPSLDNSFIIDLLANAYQGIYCVKATQSETKDTIKRLLHTLKNSIKSHQQIKFNYNNKDYNEVSPYQLVNVRGVWYLAADDNGKLKSFHLTKIINLIALNQHFSPEQAIQEQIESDEGVYFGKEKSEVIVKVDSSVAHYFKRRALLPEQETVKSLDNGDLLLSCKIAQPIQITALVKHWMPHLTLIGSNDIQQQIINDVHLYLDNSPREQGENS